LPALDEAGVIRAIVSGQAPRDDVALGPGDDAAVLVPRPGKMLVCAMDTINEGVHFPAGFDPAAIGHRALAVNLSDLAAMGAEPAWAALSLSIADPQASWVQRFARGLRELAGRYGVVLVGGDTVSGPLSVSVHLSGFVEPGRYLTREGAVPGDRVYVTGHPGQAAYGLARWNAGDPDDPAVARFAWPEPRVQEGRGLAGIATACIDVSDGLATDLARVAASSGVRIRVEMEALPLDDSLAAGLGEGDARTLALTGGDDYELCFTVPADREPRLKEVCAGWACRPTRIGTVAAGVGLEFVLDGRPVTPDLGSAWSHFGEAAP
jgi:thiamine-monophosphate kinase